MKCLSIRQPWAAAIVAGLKPLENRTWQAAYRGPLLIHASARMTREDQAEFEALTKDFPKKLRSVGPIPMGCIIGIAELYDIRKPSDSAWYADGQFAWMLRDARPIAPIPYKGRLGLFDVDVDIPLHLPEYMH